MATPDSQSWLAQSDITESDIVLIANIYNDHVAKIHPFLYKLDLSGDFTKKSWCKDIFNLIRLMAKLDAKPRIYIQAQFTEYKKPVKKARQVPTIAMMVSPAGIERYERFCEKMGATAVPAHKVSVEEMIDFSKTQMQTLMKRLNIQSEKDFFKDPYLIAQLSKSFVKSNPFFNELVSEGYYQKLGISPDSIFP